MDHLSPGQQVKIAHGPFAEYDGVVQRIEERGITVLLRFLGRETPLLLQPRDLEWEGKDLRPEVQEDLTRLLDQERRAALTDWWYQQLDQAEEALGDEYRAFLLFRAQVEREHLQRVELVHHRFAALLADMALILAEPAKVKALWANFLEQWHLKGWSAAHTPLGLYDWRRLTRLKLLNSTPESDPYKRFRTAGRRQPKRFNTATEIFVHTNGRGCRWSANASSIAFCYSEQPTNDRSEPNMPTGARSICLHPMSWLPCGPERASKPKPSVNLCRRLCNRCMA